jgi:serralysin
VLTITLSDPDTKPERTHREVVTTSHFGINLVASAIPPGTGSLTESGFGKALAGLSPGTLRFPGGTVTEASFDMSNPDGPGRDGLPLLAQSDAMAFAAANGATLDIVLPTRTAFGVSAAQSLSAGTYGHRTVSAVYLDQLTTYVTHTLQEAAASGARIGSFEIGNEFWLGGEMTALEYGQLARAVLQAVQAAMDAVLPAGSDQPDLLLQSLTAAGRYSPKDGTPVWISGDQVSFAPVAGWQKVVMPGQGSAAGQAQDIADQITGLATGQVNLAGLVDGLVAHDYNDRGHRTPGEGAVSYMFSQFDRQEARLGLPSGSLTRHVTEWNAKSLVDADADGMNDAATALNRGLPHAGLLAEMFYQMLAQGIDAAAIWPAFFPAADTTNLIASADYSLRIPGAMFSMMQESLIGMTAAFDSHDAHATGVLDTYGFVSPSRLVLLAASRSATASGPLTLDLDAVGEKPLQSRLDTGRYFIAVTELAAIDADGQPSGGPFQPDASPVLYYGDGYMGAGDDVSVGGLGSFGVIRIELTFVNDAANLVEGRGGNDRIEAMGGNDTLTGADGNDTLLGGKGSDTLFGGTGDDWLEGDLWGDWLQGETGNDTLIGGNADDMLNGGDGEDRLSGDAGHDRLDGGAGRDRLTGGTGTDILTGGAGADAFVYAGTFGQDRITDFRPAEGDLIDLSGLTGKSDITGMAQLAGLMSVQGGDLVLALRAGTIILEGAAGMNLPTDSFLF